MRLVNIGHFMLSLLLGFIFLRSPSLYAQTYSAGFNESEWAMKSGSFACSLTHKVPGFGAAQFIRNTGGGELLELKPSGNVAFNGLVKIESIPPMWRIDAAASAIGQLQVSVKQPVRMTTAHVTKIGDVLMQGNNVVFSSTQADGNTLRVILEARNFNPAYERYKACISALIPYTFDQLARMQVNYAPNAGELSAAAKTQLDKLVRYAKADAKVLGILIDAHSDLLATPEEGDVASQRQAELVAAYLVSKGVSASIITNRWHGDKFPIANNYTQAGQAQNRRITIRLESEATRKEMEKKMAAIIAAEEKAAEAKIAAEKATQEKAAQEKAVSSPAALPANLQQLEQMVERQDITRGIQPNTDSMR